MIAKVVIDIAHHDVSKPFDYQIPNDLLPWITKGMRVKVPFHHGVRLAIVLDIVNTSSYDELKTIIDMDSSVPICDQKTLDHVDHLVHAFAMTYQDAFSLVIPMAFQTVYHYQVKKCLNHQSLQPYVKHFDQEGIWHLTKQEEVNLSTFRRLEKKGIIKISQTINNKGLAKPKHRYIKVSLTHAKYQHLLDLMVTHQHYRHKDLILLGLSASNIKTMLHDGLIEKVLIKRTQSLIQHDPKPIPNGERVWLHGSSDMWIDDIKGYIKTIQNQKQSMLIIVPEHRLLEDIQDKLEGIPFIFTSTMTHQQKVSLESHIQKHPSIVIGTKRSMFLNYYKLNLVIILKSYHEAYDMHLGTYYDVNALSHSLFKEQTVCFQTPFNTLFLSSISQLNILKKPLLNPNIETVSMKQELLDGHTEMLSRSLKQSINETINQGKNVVILFQRKGYQAFHMCRMCGEVSTCPTCGQKLIVSNQTSLFCLQCGHTHTLNKTCSKGHENYMKPVGIGLDYVVTEMKKMYPKHRISKVTKDDQPEDIFDVIIGTQSVINYVNENTGLTAVLMADMLWNHHEYYSYEKAFYLMMSLMRHAPNQSHKTLIQAYENEHRIIKGLSSPDTFIAQELRNRKLASLPPFVSLYDIYIASKDYLKSYKQALQYKEYFHAIGITVIGPRQDIEDQHFILTVKVDPLKLPVFYQWMDTHTYFIERK